MRKRSLLPGCLTYMEFAQNVRNSRNSEHLTSQPNKIYGRFMGNIMKNNYALMESRLIMYHCTCKYKLYGTHCCRSVTSNYNGLCDIFALFALKCITDKCSTVRHSQHQMVEASYIEFLRMKKRLMGYI
jgi:hypothetical protein